MKYLFTCFLALVIASLPFVASSDTAQLTLARIIVIEDDAVAHDSYIESPRAHGKLFIETDSRNIIRSIDYDAWFRGEPIPLMSDAAVVLDYSETGAQYEVMSLITNDQYFVTFLRRAPQNDSYDPATILMIDMGNGVAILDYRYEEQ